MIAILAALALGFAWGYGARYWQTRKAPRGVRLIKHDVVVPGIASMNAVVAEEWRLALSAFTLWAEKCGLSEGAVVSAGICSGRGYRQLAGVLKSNGILVAHERSRTRYAPGYCGALVRSWLRRGKLVLRLPPTPPPAVHVPNWVRQPCADVADGRRWTQTLAITEGL